jgi:hypothetical protein
MPRCRRESQHLRVVLEEQRATCAAATVDTQQQQKGSPHTRMGAATLVGAFQSLRSQGLRLHTLQPIKRMTKSNKICLNLFMLRARYIAHNQLVLRSGYIWFEKSGQRACPTIYQQLKVSIRNI